MLATVSLQCRWERQRKLKIEVRLKIKAKSFNAKFIVNHSFFRLRPLGEETVKAFVALQNHDDFNKIKEGGISKRFLETEQ